MERKIVKDMDWNGRRVVFVHAKLYLSTDADIIMRIAEEESMQGFIKQCIREHMQREDEENERLKEEYCKKKTVKNSKRIVRQ